jgi:hypothetical protein
MDGKADSDADADEDASELPWGAAHHTLWDARPLTGADPRAPNPPGFRGGLYTPQRTMLAAMVALEAEPRVSISDGRCPTAWAPHLQTSMGRLADRFSFGKTVVALALICARRQAAAGPPQLMQPLVTMAGGGGRQNRALVSTDRRCAAYDPSGPGFLPEVRVQYSRRLALTVVAASANVISQWERETRRFTDLRWHTVENVRSLREFEQMWRRGEVDGLDIVFVKAGRVTSSYAVEGGEPGDGHRRAKTRPLFEAMARLFEGVLCARLIIDDYDTLKLGGDDCFIPAGFTWLISATRRQTAARAPLRAGHKTVEDFFRANLMTCFPILGAALDDTINRVFSLRCTPEYVDAHISSTAMGFRRIFVRGGRAAAILRDLDAPEAVIEMVHADAVGTAAAALGLSAQTIGDVIRRVVGQHLESLRLAVRLQARVARARARIAPPGPPQLSQAGAAQYSAALKDGSDAEAAAAIEAASASPELAGCLDSLEAWAGEQLARHGRSLGRMRDNIREGQCQCCTVPFEKGEGGEDAYILAGCCQIIVCEACATRPSAGPSAGARRMVIQRCPNCAAPAAGVIRVGGNIDLSDAMADDALLLPDGPEHGGPPPPPVQDGPPPPDGPAANPKLAALIQLVRGAPIDCIRDAATPPYIEGLLDGPRDIPWPAEAPRKILVFTMHAESTRLVEQALAAAAIPHCVLRGCRAQKDAAVRALCDAVGIMLVTAAKDCAGLHLPFVSHIVFYHRVLDRNVEAQVAARGQRLGRQANLEIITLVNEVEAADLAPD